MAQGFGHAAPREIVVYNDRVKAYQWLLLIGGLCLLVGGYWLGFGTNNIYGMWLGFPCIIVGAALLIGFVNERNVNP